MLVALLLALTPLGVPSGWAAWAAAGYVQADDGAWDTLFRALVLRGDSAGAGALLLAGALTVCAFLLGVAGVWFRRAEEASSAEAWAALTLVPLAMPLGVADLIQGTRGMLAATLMLAAWRSSDGRTRALCAGLSWASGPMPALVALVFAGLPMRFRGRPTPRSMLLYGAAAAVSLGARVAAFGNAGAYDLWRQGNYALEAAAIGACCTFVAHYAVLLVRRAAARAPQLIAVVRGPSTWVLGLFAMGAWWAAFGSRVDEVLTRPSPDGLALMGIEFTGERDAWVLHADTASFARHLGARAVGISEPGTRHMAVFDPFDREAAGDLLELRRSVYLTGTWPEDRVVNLARQHPLFLASSAQIPTNIARYALPQHRLWRLQSEPRGAADRVAAMDASAEWFPAPAASAPLSGEADPASDAADDTVAELRARVVLLLRTGDPQAKYAALNQLAQAAPTDGWLAELTRACQSANPKATADTLALKFPSAGADALRWHRRF